MILWTIQPLEVWKELNEKGYYVCDTKRAPCIIDGSFVDAYEWLVTVMNERCKKPSGVECPVWAWHTTNWEHKKPDLRKSCYGKKGEKCVCLEIEIPDDEVILSDFEEWHRVLNDSYCDSSLSEEEWEKELKWFDNLPRDDREKVKRESWMNIFDVTPFENEWTVRGRYIQATFWRLNLNNVKKVQFFTCR